MALLSESGSWHQKAGGRRTDVTARPRRYYGSPASESPGPGHARPGPGVAARATESLCHDIQVSAAAGRGKGGRAADRPRTARPAS